MCGFGPALIERTDIDGRELIILDGSDELHIRVRDYQATQRPAVLLPVDSMSELRLDIALRFIRQLAGQRTTFLPAALRLTAFQKRRLIQLLHAFDIHEAGGWPPRDSGRSPHLRVRIPTKAPVFYGMMAPGDSGIMAPPFYEMIPPGRRVR